jgi:membrane-associated protein
MELIRFLLDVLKHLDQHLNDLAAWNLPAFYVVLFLIIFAETGLVVTPFLPGDSLLFALGAVVAMTGSPISLPLLLGLLIVAAVLGDAVNYAIGYRLGPKVFRYEQSWFFNKRHLLRAQEFYERYGSKTIILARFVPIVRTFAPFVAGVGTMNYGRFLAFNIVGGIAWVVICTQAGWWLAGNAFVEEHFEIVVIMIVAISLLPAVIEYAIHRWGRKKQDSLAGSKLASGAPADAPASAKTGTTFGPG